MTLDFLFFWASPFPLFLPRISFPSTCLQTFPIPSGPESHFLSKAIQSAWIVLCFSGGVPSPKLPECLNILGACPQFPKLQSIPSATVLTSNACWPFPFNQTLPSFLTALHQSLLKPVVLLQASPCLWLGVNIWSFPIPPHVIVSLFQIQESNHTQPGSSLAKAKETFEETIGQLLQKGVLSCPKTSWLPQFSSLPDMTSEP